MAPATMGGPVNDTPIIDVDVHLHFPWVQREVAAYVDPPYDDLASPVAFENSGWNRYLGGKIESQTVEGPADIHDVLCDSFGIDVPIINTFARLGSCPSSDLAVNLMPGYNDLLLDRFLDGYDHFRGLATVAPQKPAAAAEEIDRIGDEDQIVGVFIDSTGTYPPLGDESYDVLYRACEDHGLPVAFHGNGGGFVGDFAIQNKGLDSFLEVHILSHLWAQTVTLTSLIVQGVPVKFPDLDFVLLEAGVSWIPYMMFRLNKEYSIRRSEAPLLERMPEEYVRDRFFFSTQPIGEPQRPEDLQQIIDIVGDQLMFATDYPHWDFDHPDGLDRYVRSVFSGEDRDAILHGTASEVFGIDV